MHFQKSIVRLLWLVTVTEVEGTIIVRAHTTLLGGRFYLKFAFLLFAAVLC